jgi:cell division protein FtsQ
LRVLLLMLGTLLAFGLAVLAVQSPLLDVDRITVAGTHRLTPAEIRTASGVEHRDAMFFVNTGAVTRRLERLPWVQRAVVRRTFPGTLRISVTEYQPSTYVHSGNQFALIAPNGRVIALENAPSAGTVEIRGVRKAPAVGELLSPPDAARVVQQLPSALAQQVRAVDVGGVGIALDLASGGAIRLGNTRELAAKAQAALAVLASNGAAPFTYIDVSTPATPTLRQ